MKKSERIDLVLLTVKTIRDSLNKYEEAEEKLKYKPCAGYDIASADSKASIVRRCRQAREELQRIINELE
ncbi:MAG: hypothetical protein IKW37_01610 [Bacteroidaceae bacterium]|nr:hypothetical protein [Bacteroidaceae bacterium]